MILQTNKLFTTKEWNYICTPMPLTAVRLLDLKMDCCTTVWSMTEAAAAAGHQLPVQHIVLPMLYIKW